MGEIIGVCVDCLMVIAGYSDHELGSDVSEARKGLAERWAGYDLVPTAYDDDDPDHGPWFSWSPCDGCGSTLGGDRHGVMWFERD